MREMKDSGICGIGEIPTAWDIQRIKYLFSFGKGLPITKADLIENGLPVISYGQIHSKKNNGTEIKKELLRYVDFEFEKMYPSCEVFQYDFVFADTSEDYEGCGNCVYKRDEEKLFAGYHDVVLHSKIKQDNRYYAYLFQTDGWRRQIRESVYGVKVFSITQKTIGNASIVIPSVAEQTQISDFLDLKCCKIDAIATDIQSEIDTLQEYKKSVITEAVTKGLNPDKGTKDSGVAWCPQIPSHWKYTNPKALFKLRDDKAIPYERQLTASQEYGIVYQDEYMEMTGNRVVTVQKDFSILKHVEPGDFVISMRSFQGGLEYSEKRGCISSAYVMLIPNEELVYAPFYRWFFKSSKYINAIQCTSNLVRDGQAMRYSNFVQVPLFIIPMDEQKAIAEYLDDKVSRINAVLKEKQEMLATLAEYKKSLIYEYVTGKKEVPTEDTKTVVALEPRMMLLGTIIDKLGKNQKGRIQLQKIMYLADMHLGLNRNVQYYRYDHGPYDIHLNDYIDNMVRNGWYQHRNQGGTLLVAGKNHADFLNSAKNMFGDKETEIGNLLNLLQSMNVLKRTRMERIATLYAAWNDFLLEGITPTDDQIIQEVMTNWTENKGNTKYETWQDSLNKMKTNGLIPKGTGLHTLPKPQKEVADYE